MDYKHIRPMQKALIDCNETSCTLSAKAKHQLISHLTNYVYFKIHISFYLFLRKKSKHRSKDIYLKFKYLYIYI